MNEVKIGIGEPVFYLTKDDLQGAEVTTINGLKIGHVVVDSYSKDISILLSALPLERVINIKPKYKNGPNQPLFLEG